MRYNKKQKGVLKIEILEKIYFVQSIMAQLWLMIFDNMKFMIYVII